MSDPLESELAALRPRPVSPDLRDRVAERLSASAPRRRWVGGIALVGALAVAGTIALVRPNRKEPIPLIPPAVVPPTPALVEPESPPPSVLVYRRALARSPEALDELLDRQAAAPTEPDSAPVNVVNRSPGAVNAFIGDD